MTLSCPQDQDPFLLPSHSDLTLPQGIALHLDWLKREGARHNLTSVPKEKWGERHVLDSLAPLLAGWKLGIPFLDLGTGAGFPGIPLAFQSKESQFALLESRKKVCQLLESFLRESNLDSRGMVLSGRAETLGHDECHRGRYETVVTRAVATLPVLIELGVPFLAEGGELWCWKSDLEEIDLCAPVLKALGAEFVRTLCYRLPSEEDHRFIVSIRKIAPTPESYPRREGIPVKRPILR
jgi:16S rRNA (guanine527-N7)-methyltransferase